MASERVHDPHHPRIGWPVVIIRVLFAFLGFSALVTEVATLVAQHRFAAGDFFSYFTVEANLLTVISLMVSAFAAAGRRSSRSLETYRGAVAFFMTTVILIFIVLLSGYPASELTAVPWDNTVLHYIMPIVVILDWLLLTTRRAVSVRTALAWLLGPLVYLVYSMVRGGIVGWYPYPFMDPDRHGYLAVVVTSVVIAVVLSVIAVALAVLPRWTALDRAQPTGL